MENPTETKGRKPEVQRYETVMWGGKIPVFVCKTCNFQIEDEDTMIMHIVGHYPVKEQAEVLDILVEDGYDDE